LTEGALSILQILTETIVLLGIISLLILVEPTGSILVFLVLFILTVTFHKFTKRRIEKWGGDRQFHMGQALKNLQQGLGAIKELKLMQNEDFFINRFHYNNSKTNHVNKKMTFMSSLPRLWLEIFAILGVIILIVSLLLNDRAFIEIIPVMGLFAGAAFRILPSITTTVHYIQSLTFCTAAINRIHKDIQLESIYFNKNPNSTNNNSMGHDKVTFKKSINLNKIFFTYEGNSEPTINNLSLEFFQGMKVGLIGESGAGKSTLINIFLGLLIPNSGQILVDGQDVLKNISQWYKIIGYVPQNIYLTDDSLRRNIAFGIPDESIDNQRINKVMKMSNIDKFVSLLPDGLDTVVGERGTRLSGGQLQRIGIARALYRQPKILVLDEATSSLDVENEKDIIETLDNLKGDITILIISHRFSTTKNCDMLFQLKNKNIELIKNT
ncbi:ABC transporter ATP-binding protein/permease, partial [Alphaproteobacteria bacterium]|nr:ABC transporter ATP-binding protein/permease [Alphaproteobacteria bacterium]